MFARQKNLASANTYTTTLALLALLETRSAGLPWDGSIERRDQLLKQTAQRLIDNFDDKANPPGWHAEGESTYEVIDGLTLQIYAELLRAEAEAGIELPAKITDRLPGFLANCASRDLNFPVASGEFAEMITDRETGRDSTDREAIGFLWYPWAINASEWWLRRAERTGAPMEDRVQVKRTISNLVVMQGDAAVKTASSEWTFQAAETLYGISVIPSP